MELLNQISEYLQQGDDEKVFELTGIAIKEGISPKEILDDGLLAGIGIIGKQFKNHEIFLPDVLLAAKAMQAGLNQIKPLLERDKIPGMGKIVLGTVKGDVHDIGKNLVGIMLKGAGYDVIDLGKDVASEQFVETAIIEKANVVGLSALLTTTMPVMKEIISMLKEKDPEGNIKTIIGGAPVTKNIADEYGADAYAFDAANAIDQIKLLI
ncbi:MAG: corrinoid protein [Bacteroidetes bacterium]|nr:corrinoid protein [Bacteroidota bacterium]